MSDATVKGPASYFPSIEKKYGEPVSHWQQIIRAGYPAKHMELVTLLKNEHGSVTATPTRWWRTL